MVASILLHLAITERVIGDREKRAFKSLGSDCGTHQNDTLKPESDILDIREACNKIIDAETVRFDMDDLGEQKYLNPIIYLYGSQQKKEWRAQLNVINFCKDYASLVMRF
mgnify:CR=1 FL=1